LEDYLQFTRLILNGGELNGVRLLGRKTMELMGSNHIPAKLLPLDVTFPGFGFGLGFSVQMDVPQTQALGSVGTIGWGGLASTTFWVDPQEDLIAILMTQFIPLDEFNLHADFRNLVYQAMIE
jgi:CubicO group peptidase (beta-lactamase class C family)